MNRPAIIEQVQVWIECERCEGAGFTLEPRGFPGELWEIPCEECEREGGYFEDCNAPSPVPRSRPVGAHRYRKEKGMIYGPTKRDKIRSAPEASVRLSANEQALLLAMNRGCSSEYEDFGGKTCYPFKSLAVMCPELPSHLIRRTVRSLARKGLTGFERGLMCEDGGFAGAGYGIERAGRRLASAIEARSDATGTGAAEGESAVAESETPK